MDAKEFVRCRPIINDTVAYNKLDIDDEPIGSGAFGAVYKAVHRNWGCRVAYKKLGIQFITEERHIKDLKNEAEIHRQLRHPNIVSTLGIVLQEGNYGLVLEYVRYGSLDQFIGRINEKTGARFQMSSKLKTKFSHDVCCGMSYLHSLVPTPVIHGDLKLQNLVVGESLNIKISDFGLSKWKDYSRSHTYAGTIQGTLSHIPPEKWLDLDLRENEKFDVYSFGILQWEMFAEEKAFETSKNMIMSLVISGIRPSLEKLPGGISSSITDRISACWKQEPEKRPIFPGLLNELKPFIQGAEAVSEIEQAVKDVLEVYHARPHATQHTQSVHSHKLRRVTEKLSNVIRRTNQILRHLLQRRALTPQEFDEVQLQSLIYNLARRLIDILSGKPATAYQCFLDALEKTDQCHLCQLLENEGDVLNVAHGELLIDNYSYLVSNLTISTTSLLDRLHESHVVDDEELAEIRSKSTEHRRVDQLLHYIMRTSEQQYQLFLSSLSQTGQGHIVEQLYSGNGTRLEMPLPFSDEKVGEKVNKEDNDSKFHSRYFLSKSSVTVRIIPGSSGSDLSEGICGISVIGDSVFVARTGKLHVEIYDLNDFTLPPRQLKINDDTTLDYSRKLFTGGLAGCSQHNCLYVSLLHYEEAIIHRIELSSTSVTKWTIKGKCSGLSVTSNHNLLVTIADPRQLEEYTTDGILVRQVILHQSIESPQSCAQLSSANANFVISHGGAEERVCLVDASGQILNSYGDSEESDNGRPTFNGLGMLAVDKDNYVFADDYGYHRVLLLSPKLTPLGDVQIPGHTLKHPFAVYLDEINRCLYIGEMSGRLLVVQISSRRGSNSFNWVDAEDSGNPLTGLDFLIEWMNEKDLEQKLSTTTVESSKLKEYNFSKVNQNKLEGLLDWLDRQEWAIQYYDSYDAFHIAVCEQNRNKAEKMMKENEFDSIDYLPIKIVKPCPTELEFTMQRRAQNGAAQNCYSTVVVEYHTDTARLPAADTVNEQLQASLPPSTRCSSHQLLPNQKIRCASNGGCGLFGGVISGVLSAPYSKTYGLSPGHLFDKLPRKNSSADRVFEKLPREDWHAIASCATSGCQGHDPLECVEIFDTSCVEVLDHGTTNVEKDELFEDLALLRLNDYECQAKNFIYLDNNVYGLTLFRQPINRDAEIFFIDQDGARKMGKVYNACYTDKSCTPSLCRTIAITCSQGLGHLQRPGDSGALVLKQSELGSNNYLPVLGVVLYISRPKKGSDSDPRPPSVTIANRLSWVLDRRFGEEKMAFTDDLSANSNQSAVGLIDVP